jgi:glutamine synthetase
LKNIPSAPGSLEEALDALAADHQFLLRGDVFNEGLIKGWIDYKYTNEVVPVRIRPTPWEFMLYYDI